MQKEEMAERKPRKTLLKYEGDIIDVEDEDMQKIDIALILIILGLIVIAFTLLGLVPVAVLSGFLILMLGIGLILAGISEMGESEGASLGIRLFILGIIALILGIGFIFSPEIFAGIVGFFVWIIGLFLIIPGIARILSRLEEQNVELKT